MTAQPQRIPLLVGLLALALLLPARGEPVAKSVNPEPRISPEQQSQKTPPVPSPSPTPTRGPSLTMHEVPGIRAKVPVPEGWTFLPGKPLEGDVLLVVKEKIRDENDPWTTGFSMTVDRNGAADSGLKPGEYALGIAREAREKAGDEASAITESTNGVFREIRFDFPVQGDAPLMVTEILRANERTGTVAVILWQAPRDESASLRSFRDAVLSGITLDPAQ